MKYLTHGHWIGLVLLLSCQSPPKPSFRQHLQGLQAAPYRLVHDEEPFRLQLDYQPPWLQAARELLEDAKQEKPIDPAAVEAHLEQYQGTATFLLTVSPHPTLSPEERKRGDIVAAHPDRDTYANWLNHLMYGMHRYIYLVTPEGEKVPVGVYHLDRNWGMGFTNRLLLNFPLESDSAKLTEAASLELVVQRLYPTLPEVRFAFPENPIRVGNLSAQEIADARAKGIAA